MTCKKTITMDIYLKMFHVYSFPLFKILVKELQDEIQAQLLAGVFQNASDVIIR